MDSNTPIDRIMAAINSPRQFGYENGITLTELRRDYAAGELVFGPNSINPHGNIHGGAIATLADVVAGCCACARGSSCVTANCSMEFLRPATTAKLYCEATPKKMGRTLAVIQFTVTNDQNVVVATGTYTFFLFEPGKKAD